MKKTLLGLLVASLPAVCAANTYFVVVPVPNKTVSTAAINVALAGHTLPGGLLGLPYDGFNLNSLLSVTGDPAYTGYGVRWELVSGNLPPGLTLGTDGALTGTPTAAGTASFQVRATYKTKSGQQAYQLVVVNLTVSLAAGTPPQALVGQGYSYDLKPLLMVSGDSAYTGSGVTWSLVNSTLPAGLYLTADGFIGGTPTAAGSGSLTARASYKGVTGEQTYQVVALNIQVSLASGSLPKAFVGARYTYDFKPLLSVTGDPSYTGSDVEFRLGTGALPSGLQLSSVGVLSGTPVSPVSNQTFSVVADYRNQRGSTSYAVTVGPAFFEFNPVFNSGTTTTSYNIRNAAVAAGWDGVRPLRAHVVNYGDIVASSTGAYALITGAGFPDDSMLTITNHGRIVGAGGAGGRYNTAGSPGGPALLAQYPVRIDNKGTIAGGGGGGGGSQTATKTNVLAGGAGGGGGQGAGTPAGGARDPAVAGEQYPQGTAGGNGSLASPGLGGSGISSGYYPNQFRSPWYCTSARAGAGGSLGQPGGASEVGSGCPNVQSNPGGAPGNAITGRSFVTWTYSNGQVYGPQP